MSYAWVTLLTSNLRRFLSGARSVGFFPSLYEGFGLPVAGIHGKRRAVVLTRAAALPEVAGEAGTYTNALDVEDVCQAMVRLNRGSELLAGCQALGWSEPRRFLGQLVRLYRSRIPSRQMESWMRRSALFQDY